MADGGRVSPIMKATAQALDPAQRQAVAAYYASLPAPLDTDKLAATAMGRAAGRHWRLAGHPRRLGQECPRLQPMPWSRRHRRRRQLPRAGGPVGCLHFRAVARLAPGPAPARPAGPDARRGHPPDRRRDRCRVGLLRRPAPGRRATGRASRRTGSQAMNPRLTRLPGAWLAAALALSMSATALAAEPRPSFTPPSAASLPDTEFGKIVRQENRSSCTPQAAGKFVGNDLNCSSCHLDAGRRPDSAPMWAAYVLYPAYRAKNGHVNTLAERLQGCFRYSMNGKPPAADDPVLTALQTYMFWLASKAPTGVTLEGQGYRSYPRRRRRPTTCVAKRFTPSTAPCAMALKARARRTASTGSSPPYGGGLVQLGRGHAPDRQRGRFHQGQHAAGTGRHAERPGSVGRGLFHERPRTAAGPALRRVGGRDPRQVPRLRRLALRHRGQRPSAGQRFPAPGGKLLQAAKP